MPLDPEEIRRRLVAGRTLRGFSQIELAKLLVADGLGKHDVGRLERGEMQFRVVHRDSLCRHLRLPPEWFTADQIDELFEAPEPASLVDQRLDRLEGLLAKWERQPYMPGNRPSH